MKDVYCGNCMWEIAFRIVRRGADLSKFMSVFDEQDDFFVFLDLFLGQAFREQTFHVKFFEICFILARAEKIVNLIRVDLHV